MESLPLEVLHQCCLELTLPDIIALCCTEMYYRDVLLRDTQFWAEKYRRDFTVVPVANPRLAYFTAYQRLLSNRMFNAALYDYEQVTRHCVDTVQLNNIIQIAASSRSALVVASVIDRLPTSACDLLNIRSYIIPEIRQLLVSKAPPGFTVDATSAAEHAALAADIVDGNTYHVIAVIRADAVNIYKYVNISLTWSTYVDILTYNATKILAHVQPQLAELRLDPTSNLEAVIDGMPPDYVAQAIADEINTAGLHNVAKYINVRGLSTVNESIFSYVLPRVPREVLWQVTRCRLEVWQLLFAPHRIKRRAALFAEVALPLLTTLNKIGDVYLLYLANVYYGLPRGDKYENRYIQWNEYNVRHIEVKNYGWYQVDAKFDNDLYINITEWYVVLKGMAVVDGRAGSMFILAPHTMYHIKLLEYEVVMHCTSLCELAPELHTMLARYKI